MDFTSLSSVMFICFFFFVFAFLLRTRNSDTQVKDFVSYFSLILYTFWFPPGGLLVLFFAVLIQVYGFIAELWPHRRKIGVWISVLTCLATLFIFKYYNFFVGFLPSNTRISFLSLILPVGISFYTFSAIGYLIDLYTGRAKVLRRFPDNLFLIAFWPHLAAGPILRSSNVINYLQQKIRITYGFLLTGTVLILGGAAKKLLISDNIGAYVNANLSDGGATLTSLEALVTLLGFSAQIYADFSGYSDMAIGFALLLGFQLPANFNYPYRATSLQDFWRRWHISLSFWFRDYVFIPLGGSRKGDWRTCLNLFLVFAISGLWHGAGVNFVIWGCIHGLALIVARLGSRLRLTTTPFLSWILTMAIVIAAWAFFRLPYDDALRLLGKIVDWEGYTNFSRDSYAYLLPLIPFIILVGIDHLIEYYQVDDRGLPYLRRLVFSTAVATVAYATALMLSGTPLPFIYFNF